MNWRKENPGLERWEKEGGPRQLGGLSFCGWRHVIAGQPVVCHDVQGHEERGRREHQVMFRNMMLELDNEGMIQ